MLERFSSIAMADRAENEQGFDLLDGINFVWRQWKFIASIVGVTLLVSGVYVLKQTPLFTAQAQVLLEPRADKPAGSEASSSNPDLDDAMIGSQLAIVKSTMFLRRVVEKERLVSDPEFGSRSSQDPQDSQGSSLLATIRSWFSTTAEETKSIAPAPAGGVIPPNELASIGALMGATTVNRVGVGYILAISVTSVDPARAARLANAVADAYVVEKLDARFEAAKRGSVWLSDRLVELRQQLRESEEAVAKFRADHGLVQSGTNVTLGQQQISELNAKLVATRTDLAEKKARLDLLRSIIQKGGNVQSMPDLPVSLALQALRAQESAISQKEADLVSRYNDRHPLVVNVRAEHRDIQRAIDAEMQRIAANINNEYELAKSRTDVVEREFRAATGQSNIDDRTAITLRELERTAAVNKSLFEDFLSKSKIAEGQATFQARDARVITPAVPPGAPSYPKKTQAMAVALVLGLLLGVGGAVAKEKLNAGFTTSQQVEDMLGLPLLTSVGSMTPGDLTVSGKVIPIPYYTAVMPLSRFSEVLRTLRSGIQMTDVDNPPKVIQLTSTLPNEGKTTLGMALAISVAASGQKVLFIDADLRHSSASRFFGMLKQPGLVDMLLGGDPLSYVKFNEDAKLWVLAAGSKTQNPTDLLASERMHSFITRCKQSYDFVLIDTPPVGPVIDPIFVSHLVDKVVYVIRWASTARELVEQSIKRIPGNKKVAGVVFNFVDEKLAQKYGKHGYQSYYATRDYKKYYTG